MKKIAILLLSVVTITASAQNDKNCVTPISNYLFTQKLTQVKTKHDDARKLRASRLIIQNNCLSTAQIKQVAELFQNDYNRLAFVQDAYHSTTDKDNFYEVYNTFMYFSTVFRLHDYITEVRRNNSVVVDGPEDNVMAFPNIQYPDFRRYFGKTGCKNIINDQQFMELAQQVFDEKQENRKLYLANNSLYNRCFLTIYAMKMASLLTNENDRLTFLKKAYSKVYDPDNYKYAHQLFEDKRNKQEIQQLLGGNVVVTDEDPPCSVSENELRDIKARIGREHFNNTKINLARQIISSKKCFTTSQIIQLIKLFPYSDAQMNIAKYAYDYTTDQSNYYKIGDVFSFASDKDKFLQFLKSKNGR